jgi:hypothetical protein
VNYIDLILSFVLFVMGVLFIIRKRFRSNLWVVVLALLFLPISLITYYFPHFDIVLFGEITILQVLLYPFIKLIILLALARSIWDTRASRSS